MSEKLDIYYDHYKETNGLRKAAQVKRNKNFIVLCILEAISFFMIVNPDFMCALINETVRKQLQYPINVSNSILQSLIWVLITYVLMRYIQDTLYVERQYNYLDLLEKKVAILLGEDKDDNIFCREGANYLKDYPMVLNLIDLFYKMFAPIFFTFINIARIKQEWNCGIEKFFIICDTVMFVVIIIITWFYFFEIHDKITAWFMKYKWFEKIAQALRALLKEV